MTSLSPADAERLRLAFLQCRDMDGTLKQQLEAYAAAGREIRGWLAFRDDRAMERAAARLLKELECDIHPRQLAGSMRVVGAPEATHCSTTAMSSGGTFFSPGGISPERRRSTSRLPFP